jgi:hypothetical protein
MFKLVTKGNDKREHTDMKRSRNTVNYERNEGIIWNQAINP